MNDLNDCTYIAIPKSYIIEGDVVSQILFQSVKDGLAYFNIPTEHIVSKDQQYQNMYHFVVLPKKLYVCGTKEHERLCSGQYLLFLMSKVATCHLYTYA